MNTIKKFKHTISRYSMITRNDHIVVAVSGGPDSVCLLSVLHELKDELGIELITAHLDHGLRPQEDADETRFVESLANALELPFVTEKADSGIKTQKGSLEEKARDIRYQFLEDVKKRHSAQKIALGHTLNDQAETVLMRLLRGSGPSGLSGIPPCRDATIIRPLIQVSRADVLSYLESKGLKYVTDSSNLETRFLRNRIRSHLLPQLEEYQPRIIEVLGQTSEIMRRDEQWLNKEAKKWLGNKSENRDDGSIQIHLSSFRDIPDALKDRVIRQALNATGGTLRRISSRHIDAVNQMAMGSKPQALVNLPNGLIAKRVYDKLVFSVPGDRQSDSLNYSLDGPGTFHPEACTISLEEIPIDALPDMGAGPWTAFLDADLITYPLEIRNPRPGDSFIPLGMTGHKKLKDFFIDLKVPSDARERVPILTHKDMPLWICGYRIDDRFKVTSNTKRVLKLKVSPARRCLK
ncbi:MAG: tRNA lysidine(34) synthetase TilS [Desulfobacterales bacterium]|nr:tRNA lysidine(34) synthetase TilS [Desulfobacterales bacterium]